MRGKRHIDEEPDAHRVEGARADEPPATLPPEHSSVATMLTSLAGAPVVARADAIARLQQTGGNAAVARALKPASAVVAAREPESSAGGGVQQHTEVRTHAFTAEIRQVAPAHARGPDPIAGPIGAAMADAEKGHEHHTGPGEVAAAVGVPAAAAEGDPAPEAAAEPAGPAADGTATGPEGEAAPAAAPVAETEREVEVSVPDIKLEGAEDFTLCDALWPWLGYTGKISRGGAAPTGFGVTRPGTMVLKDIRVRKPPLIGRFLVSATLEQELKWQVRSGVGPSGQVSIGSFMDSQLTNANYAQVAADLTPDMSDLNGRPPRTQFWAEDLTERHEKFHADDCVSRAPGAIEVASNWLGTQVAADVAGVQALLNQVPGRALTALMAAMAMPAREERAYGDGAGAYSRRATAIRVAGAAGMYP